MRLFIGYFSTSEKKNWHLLICCKKYWKNEKQYRKSQGNLTVRKSGNHVIAISVVHATSQRNWPCTHFLRLRLMINQPKLFNNSITNVF